MITIIQITSLLRFGELDQVEPFSPTSSVGLDDTNLNAGDYIIILIVGVIIGFAFCFGACFVVGRCRNTSN